MIEPWQTRASAFHPRLFHALSALPESVRATAEGAIPASDQFVAALYAPADYRSDGGRTEGDESEETPEHALIFTDKSAIHITAALADAAAPAPVCIALDNVLYVKTSHVLLYGRVQLYGACQGEAKSFDMRFNAVAWPLMDVEWRGIIGKVIGLPPLATVEDRVVSEHENELLEPLPLKFADGLRRYGLYTGEDLFSVLFQPEAWTHAALGQDKQIIPDTLLALTSASLLILHEERGFVRAAEQFGLIVTRIPLPALANVQTVAKADDWEEIIFTLERADATAERRLLLEPAKAQYWRGLWRGYTAK
jgi:hypothetical protein